MVSFQFAPILSVSNKTFNNVNIIIIIINLILNSLDYTEVVIVTWWFNV